MATGYIINPTRGSDYIQREEIVEKICRKANVSFVYEKWSYLKDDLRNYLEDLEIEHPIEIFFIHASDITAPDFVTWNLPQTAYAIFYGGLGVDVKIKHPHIQCLKDEFPGGIQPGRYRFNKIVEALNAVTNGQEFCSVDINESGTSPVMEILTSLDILVQGAVKMKNVVPLNWFDDIKKDIANYLKDCDSFYLFENKTLPSTGGKTAFKNECKDLLETSLYNLFQIVIRNNPDEIKRLLENKDSLSTLHQNLTKICKTLCASNE